MLIVRGTGQFENYKVKIGKNQGSYAYSEVVQPSTQKS